MLRGFPVQFEYTLILFPSEGQKPGENLDLTGNRCFIERIFWDMDGDHGSPKDLFQVVEKGPSGVLPSPLVIPAYFYIRLTPRNFGRPSN
jgi:hypothetical protein